VHQNGLEFISEGERADDNSRGAKKLKPKCVLLAVTFLPLMSVTPASAAPRQIELFVL
jgi:hypothetical protein